MLLFHLGLCTGMDSIWSARHVRTLDTLFHTHRNLGLVLLYLHIHMNIRMYIDPDSPMLPPSTGNIKYSMCGRDLEWKK